MDPALMEMAANYEFLATELSGLGSDMENRQPLL